MAKQKPKTKKKAPAKSRKPAAEKAPKVERPRTLEGMEDSAIAELEEAAHEYVGKRDRRMALTALEVPAKQAVLDLMKKHGKEHYKRDGIEIWLISEKEKVKVKTVGDDDDGDE